MNIVGEDTIFPQTVATPKLFQRNFRRGRYHLPVLPAIPAITAGGHNSPLRIFFMTRITNFY